MNNIQLEKIDHDSKPSLFAGIDVGAEELILVIRKNGKPFNQQKFANTPADNARLVKKLINCLASLSVWKPLGSITSIWQSLSMMSVYCSWWLIQKPPITLPRC